MASRRVTVGFGYDSAESAYHFAVVIGGAVNDDSVRIEERYEVSDASVKTTGARDPQQKVTLDSYRWSRIADIARGHFNARLRDTGLKTCQWKAPGETQLAPHFGKELILLAWAVEDADPTVIPNMIANWAGLAPEERWWLYTIINATAGHPEHGRNRGWRKAIKIAFAENPASQQSSGVAPGNTGAAETTDESDSPAFSLLPTELSQVEEHNRLEPIHEDPPGAPRRKTRARVRAPQLELLPKDNV